MDCHYTEDGKLVQALKSIEELKKKNKELEAKLSLTTTQKSEKGENYV